MPPPESQESWLAQLTPTSDEMRHNPLNKAALNGHRDIAQYIVEELGLKARVRPQQAPRSVPVGAGNALHFEDKV